jgi:hypothetical protein
MRPYDLLSVHQQFAVLELVAPAFVQYPVQCRAVVTNAHFMVNGNEKLTNRGASQQF